MKELKDGCYHYYCAAFWIVAGHFRNMFALIKQDLNRMAQFPHPKLGFALYFDEKVVNDAHSLLLTMLISLLVLIP